ncbi:hypothetical protein GCM10020331_067080 [Ectobacillus funiculus]
MRHAYFVYDIAAVQLVELYKPWENPEEAISAVLSLWKEAKQEIALLLRQRKRREAEGPMIHFTAHFFIRSSLDEWSWGLILAGYGPKHVASTSKAYQRRRTNFIYFWMDLVTIIRLSNCLNCMKKLKSSFLSKWL